ncbi:MAG: tRNA (mnm(5)s(2)U34)-methyltransferase [Gammaproteobacteria bacterium]
MPRISLVDEAQRAVAECLHAGGNAVDATAGNGRDTVFLAEQVGDTGRVFAFDIQQTALAATAARLQEAGLGVRVKLIHAGHETMLKYLPQCIGKIDAIMFNLGYLPGGDKRIITAAGTTLQALDQATLLLAPGGVLTILAYPGHNGGDVETAAVQGWCGSLHGETFAVRQRWVPDKSSAPRLWTVRKR